MTNDSMNIHAILWLNFKRESFTRFIMSSLTTQRHKMRFKINAKAQISDQVIN